MVLVSKSIALGKTGKLLKGYKVVETKTGKKMYFTDDKKKENKEKKEKKEKKTKKKEENDDSGLTVDFD